MPPQTISAANNTLAACCRSKSGIEPSVLGISAAKADGMLSMENPPPKIIPYQDVIWLTPRNDLPFFKSRVSLESGSFFIPLQRSTSQ
jgi:hypothetical protein